MCLYPKKLYRQGIYKETTYNGKKGSKYEIDVFSKCGHCSQCIAEKSNNWVIRNYYEKNAHEKICFITLTYKENTFFLVKKDLQDFLKRLRWYIWQDYKTKIRFFACGEYGSSQHTARPHFHIIIYGWKPTDKKFWTVNKKGNPIFKSDYVQKIWGKGIISLQEFNEHEIPYISLYETPKLEFRKAYTTKKTALKKLLKNLEEKNQELYKHKNWVMQAEKMIKEAEKEKKKYISVKEFNTWSKALGYEEFEKEYFRSKKYTFKEYIEDKEFITPTPWIKKLANFGEVNAIKEMLLRSEQLKANLTENELAEKNRQRKIDQTRKKILEYHEEKTDIL